MTTVSAIKVNTQDIRVRVKFPFAMNARFWIAAQVMRLAGLVAGITLTVEVEK